VRLVRGNAWVEVEGGPEWFVQYASRHLSIETELQRGPKRWRWKRRQQPMPERFGRTWWHEGKQWGSLLHDRRALSGLTPYLERLAAHYDVDCEVVDARKKPRRRALGLVTADWRGYQDEVHGLLLRKPASIVDAVPRSGKTLMAARAVDAVGLPTLWIAPSVAIVRQTHEVLRKMLGDDLVARLDGDADPRDRDLERLVVVATSASAVKQEVDWLAGRKVLVLDESHHNAANSIHRIASACTGAYWRWGFTGTHFRTGEDELAMEAVCSTVAKRIPVEDLVPEYLAEPSVVFARVDEPVVEADEDGRDPAYVVYQKGVVDHEARNEMVVRIARRSMDQGVPVLVLTKRRRHADRLAREIPDAVCVKGGEAQLTSRAVDDFNRGFVPCLVGTSVLGEGVDVPRAGDLVYAAGGGGSVTMVQSYFRPLTAYPGKVRARIYDFRDGHSETLLRLSQARARMARRYLGWCGTVAWPGATGRQRRLF
jgi:superfamily II DNA or RNA helicase